MEYKENKIKKRTGENGSPKGAFILATGSEKTSFCGNFVYREVKKMNGFQYGGQVAAVKMEKIGKR